MRIRRLQLHDYRNYHHLEIEPAAGLTAVLGDNGHGKTNILEAIGFVGGLGSFRGAPDDAVVRVGSETAVVRCEMSAPDGREVLVEAEIARSGRNRVKLNRQPLRRVGDLVGVLPLTLFSPDDLELVKGSPGRRRRWLDDALVATDPQLESLRSDLDRIIRQRNSLLKQARGRLAADIEVTLDVWDSKFAEAGDRLRLERRRWLSAAGPDLTESYAAVAAQPAEVGARYESCWDDGPLAQALISARSDDVRRAVTTIGPHRDEIVFAIDGLPARTHASQGEQRSLALALRLAADAAVRKSGDTMPVVLLDDVFSELDPGRATALLTALPDSQRILTSAAGIPPAARPDLILGVVDGTVERNP